MPQSPKSALSLSLLDFFLSNGHEFLFNSCLGSLERFAVVEDYWLCFLFITTTRLPKLSKGRSPTDNDFFSCASECISLAILSYTIVLSSIIEFFKSQFRPKKWAFFGNDLTKNSKTQNRLRVSHLLIIDNKETAGVTLPSLQLTTL